MRFALRAEEDLSGLGAALLWMAPADIVGESLEFYPGIAAAPLGYVAVGTCLLGSGDPYFVEVSDGECSPLVRIPHDGLEPDLSLSESVIEVVSPRLDSFFNLATFER
jgi:hypothetical protein